MTNRLKHIVEQYKSKSATVSAAFKAIDEYKETHPSSRWGDGDPERRRLDEVLTHAQRELQTYVNSLEEDDATYVLNCC